MKPTRIKILNYIRILNSQTKAYGKIPSQKFELEKKRAKKLQVVLRLLETQMLKRAAYSPRWMLSQLNCMNFERPKAFLGLIERLVLLF